MLNVQHGVQRRVDVRYGQAERTGGNIRYREIQRVHRLRLILRLLERHRDGLRLRGPGNLRAPEDQHSALIGLAGADNTDRATRLAPHGHAIVSGRRILPALKDFPFTLLVALVLRVRFQLLQFGFGFLHLLLEFGVSGRLLVDGDAHGVVTGRSRVGKNIAAVTAIAGIATAGAVRPATGGHTQRNSGNAMGATANADLLFSRPGATRARIVRQCRLRDQAKRGQ